MSLALAIPIVGKLIDKIFPDKEAADKAKLELFALQQAGELKELEAAADIITAEAQGDSWLQKSWRPIAMLWFLVLVGAYWFGFTPENLSEDAVNGLFKLVQIGLGGYVVGRSAEKGLKIWKGGS